ncbi:hypothetical protein MF672_036740 [Actinomadura sp. ATCC 31491]|uniref:LuxR family transcriptional regulator n=2 Tax=Actinomadura luzonensis TaxID=2805427 RepID=A0ABT0G4I1_9ACTN|nr:hypothetical protein [Actinomadura luzonensis]
MGDAAGRGGADAVAARSYVLGRLALVTARFDEAADLLDAAWHHREPGLAADVAEQLAWLHLLTGDPAGAARWARRALDEPIQSAIARPRDVLALVSPASADPEEGGLAAAVAWLGRGEPERACDVLRHVVTEAGGPG